MIAFDIKEKVTELLDPRDGMAPRRIASEIRTDPLTERTARICHFMKLNWDRPDFDRMIAGTGIWCPFCPDKVTRVTPAFPESILPEGRLIHGDRALFPNMAPYDCLSAVATMGPDHFIPMTGFSTERIAGGLALAIDFFRRVRETGHPEAVYPIINWNYMPPAGSSLIHPHLQVFYSADAPNLMRTELAAARRYRAAHGGNYWDDLVALEKKTGARYLAAIGRVDWMMTFAPMGTAGDVMGVIAGAVTPLDLTEADLIDIADGLIRAMTAYDRMGIYSFNMNFFTGAEGDEAARLHLLFSPRTFYNQALGTPDIGALQKLFNETICMARPEVIRDMLAPDFNAD